MTSPKDRSPHHVTIYTDGAAEPNPGPGGYGVVLQCGVHRKELSGGFEMTTNNRMELMAAIVGLESLKSYSIVTLYSDSKYVVDSVTEGSAAKWRDNGWWRTRKSRAKNIDLWERFLNIYEIHEVSLVWVQGHSGVPDNERCDQLAMAAVQSPNRKPDVGYIPQEISESEPRRQTTSSSARQKHKSEGEPCRKCGTPLVKRIPKRKLRSKQAYYFEWYLYCPGCSCMFMVDEAKRQCDAGADDTLV